MRKAQSLEAGKASLVFLKTPVRASKLPFRHSLLFTSLSDFLRYVPAGLC